MMKLAALEDKDQRIVLTPYGRGLVVRTHKDNTASSSSSSTSSTAAHPKQEVQLLEWDLLTSATSSSKKQPTLYTHSHLPSVTPIIGDNVKTIYGRGIITDIIPDTPDHPLRYTVQLTSWRLANRSLVKCHVSPRDVQVVRKKTIPEMDAWERVSFAKDTKTKAQLAFTKKDYDLALELYSRAVDAVRYVQHDNHSSNEVRADLVEIMITCSNNAATCCAKLGRWNEAARFARNALVLLEALYKKKGMKIHTILNKGGQTDVKLFGIWKVKSLIVMARAETEDKNYAEAIDHLKKAKAAIREFDGVNSPQLEALEKEVQKLTVVNQQHKKAVLKKEKKRAKAMFGGGNSVNSSDSSSSSDAKTNGSNHSASMPQSKKESITDEIKHTKKEFNSYAHVAVEPSIKKTVSFNINEEEEDGDDDEDRLVPEVTKPWYEEHKEALILGGIGGVLAFSTIMLRSFSRK